MSLQQTLLTLHDLKVHRVTFITLWQGQGRHHTQPRQYHRQTFNQKIT